MSADAKPFILEKPDQVLSFSSKQRPAKLEAVTDKSADATADATVDATPAPEAKPARDKQRRSQSAKVSKGDALGALRPFGTKLHPELKTGLEREAFELTAERGGAGRKVTAQDLVNALLLDLLDRPESERRKQLNDALLEYRAKRSD